MRCVMGSLAVSQPETMMKPFPFAAFVVAIWTVPAWAAEGDSYESLAKESIETIDKFAAILSKIKDKKSADDVRKDFDENAKKMTDLKLRSEKLGEPPAEQRQLAREDVQVESSEASIKKLQEELNRIAKNVDGGKEIVQDLSKSLAPVEQVGQGQEVTLEPRAQALQPDWPRPSGWSVSRPLPAGWKDHARSRYRRDRARRSPAHRAVAGARRAGDGGNPTGKPRISRPTHQPSRAIRVRRASGSSLWPDATR